MRKQLSCLLVILVIIKISCFYAMADAAVYQNGDFSYILTEKGAEITDWKGWKDGKELPELIIPSSLDGYPVVGIGKFSMGISYNFDHRNSFRVVIPEGIQYLSESAFSDCMLPTKISLPSTLVNIGESCFFNVIAEIDFPNGSPCFSNDNGFLVDSRSDTLLYAAPSSYEHQLPDIKRLGNGCLDNWLEERNAVVLPKTLTSIGKVFYDLPYLEQVDIPEGLTELSSNSFFATELKNVKLPSSLTEIPAYCFSGCAVTSIEIAEGVTYIGEYAIYQNMVPIAEVTLPASVQFVGYGAFPEETNVIALNGATHFETLEEYCLRCPQSDECKQIKEPKQ